MTEPDTLFEPASDTTPHAIEPKEATVLAEIISALVDKYAGRPCQIITAIFPVEPDEPVEPDAAPSAIMQLGDPVVLSSMAIVDTKRLLGQLGEVMPSTTPSDNDDG